MFPGLIERISRLEEIMENSLKNPQFLNDEKISISENEENSDTIQVKENKTAKLNQGNKTQESKEEVFNVKKEIGEILEINESPDKKQRKSSLKDKNTLDNKPETLNHKFDEIDREMAKIQEKIRQISKHFSLISAKSGFTKQDLSNAPDLSIIDGKIQKVKTEIKNEIKSQYIPIIEYQNFNSTTENKISHLSELSKVLSESISLKFNEQSKLYNDIQNQLNKFEKQNLENREFINSLNETSELKSPRHRDEKQNELPIEPISPTHKTKPVRQFVLTYNHLKNTINELGKKVNEMQVQINLIKENQLDSNVKSEDNHINEQLKELIETNPKIASKLDIKTLQSIVNELTSRFDELKKDYERNLVDQSSKSLKEEINSIKQSIISLDNKSQIMSKSLKIVENKVSENYSFGIVDIVQSKQEDRKSVV